MRAPAKPTPSRRIPLPSAERYVVIVPVSGMKSFAGSSVVMRHWMACAISPTSDCAPRPMSRSFAPDASSICDCTMSTPVTASDTVCSTCTRGFTSMK
jgi:hypothetical protein